MTNTNRQVQMGRPAVAPPGDAKEDWWIEVELAKRLGLGWTYSDPSEVFAEMKLNMSSLNNITWDRLEADGAGDLSVASALRTPGRPLSLATVSRGRTGGPGSRPPASWP